MSYLLGDSTDAGLQFNYLDFTKEVVECAVVLVEAELELGTTIDKRRAREAERAADIKAVEEIGQRANAVVASIAKDDTPAGRTAAAIAAAIKSAVEREVSTAKSALAGDIDELDRVDRKVRGRNRDVLEKLLRAHDLPEAEKTFEIAWTTSGVKAAVRERTPFGVEAVLALEMPPNTIFVPDLRVDRLVEGVEIHAVEASGWLKKGDKLVPHKLGRYFITRIATHPNITFRLNATQEASSLGFTITVRGEEAMLVERHGDGAKEFQIEEQDKAKLCQLAARLGKETRDLDGHRNNLISIDIDGKPVGEHEHPRTLAELLIRTIAPTVRKIAQHSRNADELVLRRPLGGNRREELFMAKSDIVKLYQDLPEAGREVFAPLALDGKPYVEKPQAVVVEPKPEPKAEAKPSPDVLTSAQPVAPPRTTPTKPPPLTAPILGRLPDVPASSGPIPVVKADTKTEPTDRAPTATASDEAWEASDDRPD